MTAEGEGTPEHIYIYIYIYGCRKFSASLNRQNDSSRHIICLNDFFFSSFSRNRFSPKNVNLILSPKVAIQYKAR